MDALPAGTRLRLAAGQWRVSPGVNAHAPLSVDVIQTFTSHDPAYLWVYGHGWDCSWLSAECDKPFCVEVLVRVDALPGAVVPR